MLAASRGDSHGSTFPPVPQTPNALVQSLDSNPLSLFHPPLHLLLLLPSQPKWPGHRATAMWAAGEPRLQLLGQAKLSGGLLEPSDRHQSRDATQEPIFPAL